MAEQVFDYGIKVFHSVLPAKDEDRIVVLPFEHGTMIAIFDDVCHYSSELSEFASKNLPQLVAEQFDPTAADLDQVITQIFEDFDRSLLLKVIELFKGMEPFSSDYWLNPSNVHNVLGWYPDKLTFREGRRAVVGTTVLIGIIAKDKKHIWDGKLTPLIMSDRHNCTNTQEILKLAEEHPGEADLVSNGRVLGVLAVTRATIALGDHQLKVRSRPLARHILSYLYPAPVPTMCWAEWETLGNVTPPYLSASPVVQRHDLLPGDMLIFASDGLRDSMDRIPAADGLDRIPEADRWDLIVSLANGEEPQRLSHACIRPEPGENPAELLIKNVLWGHDAEKKAKRLADRYRDDISVVLVDLGWNAST
ncbi:phosphatase 2C-like domain-containing protein [Mycena vulgaris]|nr:phosphatase 2C-like domain-containing protein [Mycena vulgaris]